MCSHWTNRTIVKSCTLPILSAAALLVACDPGAQPAPTASSPFGIQLEMSAQDEQPQPGPFDDVVTVPTPLDIDVTQLVPASIDLAVPVVCGDITVYDQEDVASLCSPMTLAATPIVSPTCPQNVSGSVRLEVDLLCTDSDGLIVGSDNTVIDLNGHKIVCTGEPGGYFGSCQGPVFANDDNGIDTNNRNNVHIFSHVPGGAIDGFDVGVLIRPNSNDVKVKQLIITGPAGAQGVKRPGFTVGIRIVGVDCDGGTVRIGGGTRTGNDISRHSRGITLASASCVHIGHNRVHDNRKNFFVPTSGDHAEGIFLFDSPNNHLQGNRVTNNGDGFPLEAGLNLQLPGTANNLVNNNVFSKNDGNGVQTIFGAVDNDIVANEMLGNTNFDAFSDPASVNRWNENNRCATQTTPQPPPGVCGPGEGP